MPMLLYYQVMRRTYIWCLWAYAKIKFSMKKLLALNNLSDIFHTELYLAYYNTYFLLCPSIYTGVHCRHTSNLFILPQQIHRCLVKVYLLPLGFTPTDTQVYSVCIHFIFKVLFCSSRYTDAHCKYRYKSHLSILLQQIQRCTMKVYVLPSSQIHRCIVKVYVLPPSSTPIDTHVYSVGIHLTFSFCSSRYTGRPALRRHTAIPDPMVPPPMTAVLLTGRGLAVL